MKLTTLYTAAQHTQMTEDAVARGFWRNDRRILLPGTGWLCPWYFDPKGEMPADRRDPMCQHGDPFLSIHYWRDWADKRAPITVICPNGAEWCIDCKSSNGDGWIVTGEWPNITCTPSIVAGDYHGFLQNGEFTRDLAGQSWPVPNIGPDYGRKS